jgi:steroid delta-isomerase-like uncharacterized protein
MTRDELEEVARQWITLWSAPVNWALFDRIHAEDFVDHSPAGRGASKEDFASGLRELVEVFPDLRSTLEDLVVDESARRVAVRWSAIGTNRRRFLGVGPTGRPTPFSGIEIIEVSGGRVTKRWGEWDITAHRD